MRAEARVGKGEIAHEQALFTEHTRLREYACMSLHFFFFYSPVEFSCFLSTRLSVYRELLFPNFARCYCSGTLRVSTTEPDLSGREEAKKHSKVGVE